ncbi:response regulator [Planctomicrobium sp. SH668]|uniref:ATP-binding protein n=1 Tax=Planctomicrobium sp. SH668 TaxID=3448126 RepID=UPI003F5C11E1
MTKLLVVDDSVIDQKIVSGLLQRQTGWLVDIASNGKEACTYLENHRDQLPDLVLTDMLMPEMNGLDLMRNIRDKFPLLPVILMTAQGSETVAVEALQQGAASYVSKINFASSLIQTVQQVLNVVGDDRTKRDLHRCIRGVRSEYILSNETHLLVALVAHIQETLRNMEVLSENERLRTGIALEEALFNAAYHGNLEVSSDLRQNDQAEFYDLIQKRNATAPYMHRRIIVNISIDESGLEYTICDEGPGFNPDDQPDPTDPANLDKPSGRGLLLMRTFMDEVQFNAKGNEVRMTKRYVRISTAPATSSPAPLELAF